MKITKEEFNKLNQLDRIEFRQKLQLITNRWYSDFPFILLFLLVSLFHWVYIIFVIFVFLYGITKYFKSIGQLAEEYFTTQVKRSERGNTK